MVQKKSTPARGRPAAYVIDDVIARALPVFWQNGLDATSVDALETATGLNRSSLYTALDGKAGLFDRCLGSYVDAAMTTVLAPALEGEAGVDDLIDFIDRIAANLSDARQPRGCFAVRSNMRGEGAAQTARYLDALRAAITQSLIRAERVDGLDPSQRTARIDVLEAALTGMLALGSGPTSDPLAQAGSLATVVRGWIDHDRGRQRR